MVRFISQRTPAVAHGQPDLRGLGGAAGVPDRAARRAVPRRAGVARARLHARHRRHQPRARQAVQAAAGERRRGRDQVPRYI